MYFAVYLFEVNLILSVSVYVSTSSLCIHILIYQIYQHIFYDITCGKHGKSTAFINQC